MSKRSDVGRLAAVCLIAAAACHRTTPPPPAAVDDSPHVADGRAPLDPVPAGSLRAKRVLLGFAVYYLPRASADPVATLRALPEAAGLRVVSEVPAELPSQATVALLAPKIGDMPPPSAESLRYRSRGLADEQKRSLAASSQVSALVFPVAGDAVDAGLARALRVVGAFARHAGGLPFDPTTGNVFSLDAWAKRVEAFEDGVPIAAQHTMIDVYRDGELMRLVTLGMEEMGLPDLVVNNVSPNDAESMGSLLNLLSQALVERGGLTTPGEIDLAIADVKSTRAKEVTILDGGSGRTQLRLAMGERQEGDADNRLIEVVFPGPPAALQQRQNTTLTKLFGARDSAALVRHDDALLAASARARKRLLSLKPAWKRGPPPLERLLAKGPFEAGDGQTEWMWIEVTSWDGTILRGVLDSDPYVVKGLHAGARVTVQESAVFDYIRELPDGGREGNETAELLRQREGK